MLRYGAPPLFIGSWSDAIKAHTIPLRGMSGVPGRKVVTTSLTDRHKEAFDHLQSQDGMHYSVLRARAHVRLQSPLCQRDGLLIKSDASVGPFSMAADPFGTETQGKRRKFLTREALRKKLTLTLKPCCG